MSDEVRGDSSRGPTETENPNKNDNEEVRGETLRDLPEWLEEFTENMVDDSVPEHRDASSSSHELLSEPRAKVVSCKHSIFTHFPKDRNCDICLRTKITRALCRRRAGPVVPREVLSEGCESRHNHRYAVVVQELATQWIQSYPCRTKLLWKRKRAYKSSWSLCGNQKSFPLTIPWNLASPVKTFPGIIVRRHHTDRK